MDNAINQIQKAIGRLGNGIKMVLEKLSLSSIDNVIDEVASNKTMLKVKGNALNIEKLQFSFVEFDPHSHKLISSTDIYMSIGDALVFSHDVLSGKIPKLAAAEKAKGEQYPKAVYDSPLGGVNEQKAKERGLRTDGKAISRHFTLGPGSRSEYIITALQGAGHTDEKVGKLIVPEGKPEITIRVPITGAQLKSMALLIKAHVEAFLAAKYATNGYARKS